MDQDLIAYFDERFRETKREIVDTLREEIRHTHVTVEGIRDDFRIVLGSDPIEIIRERFGLRKSSD